MLTQRSREVGQNRMTYLQRHVRSSALKTFIDHRTKLLTQESATLANFITTAGIPIGTLNYLTDINPGSTYYRVRKTNRKDTRALEREDKRRRQEFEDKKKKKAVDFHKALIDHREAFTKFHKAAKQGQCRTPPSSGR
jgi:hypothetical protein